MSDKKQINDFYNYLKLEEKEPSKIWKKVHREWESKKERLNLEIEETFNKLMEKYIDLEDLIGLS